MANNQFNQLMDANVADDEIEKLYKDLQYIFDTSFDKLINEAVSKRGCIYRNLPGTSKLTVY